MKEQPLPDALRALYERHGIATENVHFYGDESCCAVAVYVHECTCGLPYDEYRGHEQHCGLEPWTDPNGMSLPELLSSEERF